MRIDYTKLQEGQTLYETGYGTVIRSTVKTKPIVIETDGMRQFIWTSVAEDGKEIQYLVTEGMEHYGPTLYLHNPYH